MIAFSSLIYFCSVLGYAFAQLLFSVLKPISLLLKWKNKEPSENEACCRSSTPNN